ncbi:hypothetical protein D3C74_59630 [compost metagenome]
MKKKFWISLGAVALILSTTAVIQATQQVNTTGSSDIKISKEDYLRMSAIIKDVNDGELPISALKEAQPLVDKRPQMLSAEVANELRNSNLE